MADDHDVKLKTVGKADGTKPLCFLWDTHRSLFYMYNVNATVSFATTNRLTLSILNFLLDWQTDWWMDKTDCLTPSHIRMRGNNKCYTLRCKVKVTWLTNNFHVQKIQSDCILTITILQLTYKAWRSIVLSLCYPLIVPGLPVQYHRGQRVSSCELGEHFRSSVGHSEGWIWFCDKDYWRSTNSRIFTPTKVGACTICFLHWLEVFSEDIPCNVLWYNCGTKWLWGVITFGFT